MAESSNITYDIGLEESVSRKSTLARRFKRFVKAGATQENDAKRQRVSGEDVAEFYSKVVELNTKTPKTQDSTIHCNRCEVETKDGSTHEKSILHMFSTASEPESRHVWINPSNNGYKLLERMGWKENLGLGVDEQGRKEPVKTMLKLDRSGVGSKKHSIRVTHFPSHIESHGKGSKAIKMQESSKRKVDSKLERKKMQLKKDQVERVKQECYRRELFMDYPDDLAAIFLPADIQRRGFL